MISDHSSCHNFLFCGGLEVSNTHLIHRFTPHRTAQANQLLSLDLPPKLQIRELSMSTPDTPFTTSTSLDSTGQSVWSCSIAAARFFASRPFPAGSKVLEVRRAPQQQSYFQ